jgi:hypothetical protein
MQAIQVLGLGWMLPKDCRYVAHVLVAGVQRARSPGGISYHLVVTMILIVKMTLVSC